MAMVLFKGRINPGVVTRNPTSICRDNPHDSSRIDWQFRANRCVPTTDRFC